MVALQVARIVVDASDKCRFDLVIGDGGNGDGTITIATMNEHRHHDQSVKWCMKAEHPVEAQRWIIALTEAK